MSFLGLKDFISYHTHPYPYDSSPSNQDIVACLASPEYISLIIAHNGVAAFLKTQESLKKANNPVEIIKAKLRLSKLSFERMDVVSQCNVLDKLGIGYYTWESKDGMVTLGDFADGITFTKVTGN